VGVAGLGEQGLGLGRVAPPARGRVEVVGAVAERAWGQDGGGQLTGRTIAPGDAVAVGDLVDGVVDRPADPDISDRARLGVGFKDQEQGRP
jgi:hypothetical protein